MTTGDPVATIQSRIGGAHGVVVTAVNPKAFSQGVGMLRRGGTMCLVGLPPGDFPLPIFDVVLKGLTIRGSIVGTRMALEEALHFAAEGGQGPRDRGHRTRSKNINSIFARLPRGDRRRSHRPRLRGLAAAQARSGGRRPFRARVVKIARRLDRHDQ